MINFEGFSDKKNYTVSNLYKILYLAISSKIYLSQFFMLLFTVIALKITSNNPKNLANYTIFLYLVQENQTKKDAIPKLRH